MSMFRETGRRIARFFYDVRKIEYAFIFKYINASDRVLDVGCGTGTFLEKCRESNGAIGVDLNPENVAYCCAKNLNARIGDALDLDFDSDSFDIVHASHLLHIFHSSQAVQFLRECGRVLKPGGLLILSTHNMFARFFRHPENARPYPPDALYRLLGILGNRGGATSPMYSGLPIMERCGLWLRRPPLIDFDSSTSPTIGRIFTVFNALQYGLFLRKFWAYDSYIIVLKKV